MKIQRISMLIIMTLVIVVSACSKEKTRELTESEKMRAEVMVVHDEVMPKTKDINRYIEALEALPSDRKNELVKQILESLKSADKAMWDWMQSFEDPPEEWDETRKVAYYRDQKIKIQEVSDEMLESLRKAGKVIKIPNR